MPELGRSARAPFQLQTAPAAAPAEDDDDDPPPRRARTEESAAIDLTPAVDVTFQLLIFFMVTASFSMQKAFDVPPAKQTEGVSVAVVVQDESQSAVKVQVDADNTMIVEEQDSKRASNYRELLELLKAEKNASADVTDIQLELHPDSTHEARVIVIDAATQAGFTRVRNKVIEW
jgi:biopolymer transport protein ExbD